MTKRSSFQIVGLTVFVILGALFIFNRSSFVLDPTHSSAQQGDREHKVKQSESKQSSGSKQSSLDRKRSENYLKSVKEITARIIYAKKDLVSAKNQNEFIEELLREMDDALPESDKKAFLMMMATDFAKIDRDSSKPLEWFSEFYPKMKLGIDSSGQDGELFKDYMMAVIVNGISRYGMSLKQQLETVEDSDARYVLAADIIPYYTQKKSFRYDELIEEFPRDVQVKIEQNILEGSTKDFNSNQGFKNEAVKMYLSGMGETGNHEKMVSKWFADPAWFWTNSDSIAAMVVEAPTSSRRDVIINEIVKFIQKDRPEDVQAWLDLRMNH